MTAAGTRCIDGVEHVGVRVGDVDQAVRLLVGGLGFTETYRGLGPDRHTQVAFVALGAFELELFDGGEAGTAVLDHVGLRAGAPLPDVARELAGRGIAARDGEVQGTRDTRALVLAPESLMGLKLHVSRRAA